VSISLLSSELDSSGIIENKEMAKTLTVGLNHFYQDIVAKKINKFLHQM